MPPGKRGEVIAGGRKDARCAAGRNPQTGETITIEARRILTFKPSGLLKDQINKEVAPIPLKVDTPVAFSKALGIIAIPHRNIEPSKVRRFKTPLI